MSLLKDGGGEVTGDLYSHACSIDNNREECVTGLTKVHHHLVLVYVEGELVLFAPVQPVIHHS